MKSRKEKLHRNEKWLMLPRGSVANKKGVVLGLEIGGHQKPEQSCWGRCCGLRHKPQFMREKGERGSSLKEVIDL